MGGAVFLPAISVQSSSVPQLCSTICDPMNPSMPGLPVHRQLPEFTETHIRRVSDAIQPSHPLLSPSPPAFNLSQHEGLFQWVSSTWSHGSQHCLTQWNYEPCHVGPPKTDGSWWRVLTKRHPLEKGTANHFSTLALRTPWIVWRGKRIWHWKMNSPGRLGAQYATGAEWGNNSRKNEEMEWKWKQRPVVDVTGDGSKVWCCKEPYCVGTWNVRSMNQSKLEVVKQEMARVNTDILGISELKWTGMGKFNSDDHYIYYCGQESLRRNGVALTIKNRVQNAVLGCNLKNDRMISVHIKANHSISQ